MRNESRSGKWGTISLFLLVGILFSQRINLASADIGRHIKNGEMILQGDTLQARKVLETNFYSYTYPDFPFLNHHWGSGVVFYLIHLVFGFIGLSIFFVLLSLATFALFFDIAKKKAGWETAFLTALILLPVISYRTEVRPESFSYFFCGLFWWILEGRRKLIYLLPVLMLLWVNLHIYFFLGLFLIGLYLLEEILRGNLKGVKKLLLVLSLSTGACLFNPVGIRGLFYPLQIFNNYGYRVLENQTVVFIDKVLGSFPPNTFFKIGFVFLVFSWCVALRKKSFSITDLILSISISYLGWSAVRNFTFFGFFSLPVICGNFSLVRPRLLRLILGEGEKVRFLVSSAALLIIFGFFMMNNRYWIERKLGWGINKGVLAGAEFFTKNNLKGPIFNNYDVGGYLIYSLYPREKIFVDNRPEAYPREFFTDVYVPMQEKNNLWDKKDKEYNFNTIFFYRRDLTPWAQSFLVSRIDDESWAPVFVDDYNIIFLKRNNGNEELIMRFELPKRMFSVSKG